ncbi:MAG: glucose-6-phosphate dehydrogenase assembly protein OpcA [Thermomicrobiales bacterium]|nr:glucose-6-phosphate dehydrogenase assembly protein OpcA [Thermomicrobiales bacterium]
MPTGAETNAPAMELIWESKDIEVGRIRSALTEQWHRWEAEYPDPSVIEPGSTEQVYMRASTVNVIVAVDTETDAEWAEAVLAHLSDYSPSRLLILVRNGRPEGAETYTVRVKVEEREHTRGVAPVRLETITILAPPGNDQSLASLSSPLLIPDLPDVLFVPYGPISNNTLVSSLFELVDILVVDTIWTRDTGASFAVLAGNATRQDVSDINDLAWSRMLVWRQLVAQFFDQPAALDSLETIEEVEILFSPIVDEGRSGRSAALLMAGWLATRLGWRAPGELVSFRDGWRSTLRAGETGKSREIVLMLSEGARTDTSGGLEKIRLVAGGTATGLFEIRRISEDEIETTSQHIDAAPVTRMVHSRCPDDRFLISQELRRLHEDPTYTAALDFAAILWPAGMDS